MENLNKNKEGLISMKTIEKCLENDFNIDELAAKAKRDYHKKWRDSNKDKVKNYNSDYWKRQAIKSLNEKED